MKTIKIKEDIRIPGTDFILEAGDKIELLTEASNRGDLPLFEYDGKLDTYIIFVDTVEGTATASAVGVEEDWDSGLAKMYGEPGLAKVLKAFEEIAYYMSMKKLTIS